MNAPIPSHALLGGSAPSTDPSIARMLCDAQALYCVPSLAEIAGKSFDEALALLIARAKANVPEDDYMSIRAEYARVVESVPELLKKPAAMVRLLGRDTQFYWYREFMLENCNEHMDGDALGLAFIAGNPAAMLAMAQHAVLSGIAHSAMLMSQFGFEIKGDND